METTSSIGNRALCLVMLLLLSAGNLMFAGTLEVCKDCRYKSIKAALLDAPAGSTILVREGTYFENDIIVSKKLILLGINQPVIDGGSAGEVFTVRADSVVIRGFTIQNCGKSYTKDLAGIRIDQQKHCRIENNRLFNTFFGIYLKHASHCSITNNIIIGKAVNELSSGNAIHLWYSKDIKVRGNICRQHRDGIYLEFVEGSLVRDNLSENNLRYGLHFMFSNNDEYRRNTFRHNGAGVAVMFSKQIYMYDNLFEDNWGPSAYGLLLKDISDGIIQDNLFVNNTVGIYGDGANRLKINNNEFRSNGRALKILGSCYGNEVCANNFLYNSFDVITNTSTNNNTYRGNYWSDYSGYDLDHDGNGDIPHKPVSLFSYLTANIPSAMILLRSPLVDMLNFAEKVMPAITPPTLEDSEPKMKMIRSYD